MGRKQTTEVLQELVKSERHRMKSSQNLIDRMNRMIGKLETSETLTQEDLRTIVYLCGAAPGQKLKQTCEYIRNCGISRLGDYMGPDAHYRIGPEHTSELLSEPIPDVALEMYVQSECTAPLFEPHLQQVNEADWNLQLAMEPDDESSIYYGIDPLV